MKNILCMLITMFVFIGQTYASTYPNIDSDSNQKAMFRAIQHHDMDLLYDLISEGANVNARAANGITALMVAIWFQDVEIVELLIDEGANVNAVDNDARTVWTYALDRHQQYLKANPVHRGMGSSSCGSASNPCVEEAKTSTSSTSEKILNLLAYAEADGSENSIYNVNPEGIVCDRTSTDPRCGYGQPMAPQLESKSIEKILCSRHDNEKTDPRCGYGQTKHHYHYFEKN
ncbi:MAG: ankyrin repeat domain-containing protein [Bdellovibrionales bacterium]